MRSFIVLLLLCGLSFASAVGASADHSIATTSDILSDIQGIKAEKDVGSRAELADQMLADLHEIRRARALSAIGDEVIDQLASILNDEDDGIRGAAAAAIGYFGTRAHRSIPELNQALERFGHDRKREIKGGEVFVSGIDSVDPILIALRRVRGLPDSDEKDRLNPP